MDIARLHTAVGDNNRRVASQQAYADKVAPRVKSYLSMTVG